MDKDISLALDVLHKGGLILYPTDTIWGIGCDATNSSAVKRIYELKKRADDKAMLVLIENENRLGQYIKDIPEIVFELLDASPEPLTIIYPGAKNLAENLIAEDGSIGIRITQDEFCSKLIGKFRKPIVSTSANISGQTAPFIYSEISDEIKSGVDYVVKWRQEDSSIRKPSGIIQFDSHGRFNIVRK